MRAANFGAIIIGGLTLAACSLDTERFQFGDVPASGGGGTGAASVGGGGSGAQGGVGAQGGSGALGGGGAGCDDDQKVCAGACVTTDDPALGCANPDCMPCSDENGPPACTNGSCSLTCEAGVGDCNLDPDDGCEVDLSNDPLHCGACGHDCLGGDCVGSVCQPLMLIGETWVGDIVVDETNVYYTQRVTQLQPDTDVRRIPKNVATVTPVNLAADQSNAQFLLTDANYVYWSGTDLGRVLKTAAGLEILFDAPVWAVHLASTDTRIAFSGSDSADSLSGSVNLIAKDGSGYVQLISGLGAFSGNKPTSIAMDANYVFWGTDVGISRVPVVGTPVATTISTDSPSGLRYHQGGLVYTTAGSLKRCDIDGTNVSTIANQTMHPGSAFDKELVIQGDEAYALGGDTIYAIGLDGTGYRSYPLMLGTLQHLAADDTAFYMVDAGYKIYRLAK